MVMAGTRLGEAGGMVPVAEASVFLLKEVQFSSYLSLYTDNMDIAKRSFLVDSSVINAVGQKNRV